MLVGQKLPMLILYMTVYQAGFINNTILHLIRFHKTQLFEQWDTCGQTLPDKSLNINAAKAADSALQEQFRQYYFGVEMLYMYKDCGWNLLIKMN